eukprot:SAG25_NODE_7616_length_470_cov_1.223720_1_plen_88_part_10
MISRAGMSYADVDKTNQARWNSFPKIVDKTNKTWWGARKTPWGEITESDYVRLCAEPRLRQRAREALAALEECGRRPPIGTAVDVCRP